MGKFFFYFRPEVPFLGKFGLKRENCQFSWNLVASLTRICRVQCCRSLFLFFDQKYPFWANLVQKTKNVSLSWNLVPRLIPISRVHWWRLLFLLLIGYIFFGQIWSKKSELSVQLEISYTVIALAKIPEREGSTSSASFYRKLPNN